MPLIKAKAKLENRKLKAKVKYPLVGKAELELGSTNKLKALVKVPFIFSAKFFGLLKLRREKMKKEDEGKKGVVESFLGAIPLFGDFLKELGKSETFKERFKEINERIEENLSRGEKKYVSVEGTISVRPLSIRPSSQRILSELKKDTSELSIQKDYAYWREGRKLMLAVKVPNEDVDVSLTGRNALLKGDNFNKKIALPAYYKSIEKKHYKNGILMFGLTK